MMMALSLTPTTLTSRGQGFLAEFSFATWLSSFFGVLNEKCNRVGKAQAGTWV